LLHPHQPRLKNKEDTSISPNITRLPLIIPFIPPSINTYGDEKFIVSGKDKNARMTNAVLYL